MWELTGFRGQVKNSVSPGEQQQGGIGSFEKKHQVATATGMLLSISRTPHITHRHS